VVLALSPGFSSFKTSSLLLLVLRRAPLVGVLGADELRSSLLQVLVLAL
jgi:hypothetical protein